VALWVGYIYLMRHALSVVLSYFGISAPWGLQFNDISVPPILNNIQTYAVVVLINAAVFVSWALYNKIVFGYRHRRRRSDPVTPAEIGAHFFLAAAQVDACQAARRIIMVHDESGRLIQCDAFAKASARKSRSSEVVG
jgi:poly-beta-1,6-N-acetyl-D-glucosamine biosynthesis protein PgaD